MRKIKLDEKNVRNQIESGVLAKEIAKQYNCSLDVIYRFCKKHNITKPSKSMIKKEFKYFTVLKDLGTKRVNGELQRFWLCECKCGTLKEHSTGTLNSGQIHSCGCYMKSQEFRENNQSWKGYEQISGALFCRIKASAKARNIIFEVTIEDIWNLYIKQDKKCKLSGLPVDFELDKNGLYTISLDRIDSQKGYTIDNVQWIVKDINFMKQDYDEEYFIKMCGIIYNYKKQNE